MDFIFSQLPYALIGIVSGITSGLFGIGGGMVIVPFALAFGISSHHAIAMSVVQMIFSSVFGSYLNYKKKNLNLKDGLFVGFVCDGIDTSFDDALFFDENFFVKPHASSTKNAIYHKMNFAKTLICRAHKAVKYA